MGFDQHGYWNDFYAGKRSRDVPQEPSTFARWVERQMPEGATLWEFGFGTARDSVWFSSQGYAVQGFDFAETAVDAARTIAEARGLDAAFQQLDLYDAEQAKQLVASQSDGKDVNIYGRFLLHSLEDVGRHNLLDIAAGVLAGGSIYLEFRTGADANGRHLFGDDHYRQYLDPQVVVDEIEARGGKVTEQIQGHGLAVYKTEDPHVARLVASW